MEHRCTGSSKKQENTLHNQGAHRREKAAAWLDAGVRGCLGPLRREVRATRRRYRNRIYRDCSSEGRACFSVGGDYGEREKRRGRNRGRYGVEGTERSGGIERK